VGTRESASVLLDGVLPMCSDQRFLTDFEREFQGQVFVTTYRNLYAKPLSEMAGVLRLLITLRDLWRSIPFVFGKWNHSVGNKKTPGPRERNTGASNTVPK
jgi:hypothetical protein